MGREDDVDAIASLLADECARTILVATTTESLSADELADRCEASPQTVYRRLDALTDADLLDAEVQPHPEGHQYKTYIATLDRAVVDLTPEGLAVRVSRRDRMADRFTRFVEGVREE